MTQPTQVAKEHMVPAPAHKKQKRFHWRTVLLLTLPFTIIYAAFLIYPTIRVVMLSFTNSDIAGGGHFIGLANYTRLIHDAEFWSSLWHTIYFILLSVVPNTAVGMIFALVVVRLNRLRNTVMAMFFLPYILPVSVVTQIWLWVLDSNYGIINFVLRSKLNWFQEPLWAMPAVAFVTVWWTVGFNILLFIAGLQAIPKEYYEAASLEGASGGLKAFRFITWPLLWPVTSLVLILQLIAQWQIFNQVYLLTAGGPFGSTQVGIQYMYLQAFVHHRGGYATTVSMALFVLILVSSLIQLRVLRFRGNT